MGPPKSSQPNGGPAYTARKTGIGSRWSQRAWLRICCCGDASGDVSPERTEVGEGAKGGGAGCNSTTEDDALELWTSSPPSGMPLTPLREGEPAVPPEAMSDQVRRRPHPVPGL